jgi:hypothetical protein
MEFFVMPFLRFSAQGHEWGFEVADGFIPAVGDFVTLWHAMPDTESDDCIDGVVTKRTWGFASDFREEDCIFFDVDLESEIPSGHIADSTEWPSSEWSKRRAELEADLESIRKGIPLNHDEESA